MPVVIDTNILVSSLWSKNGLPANFMSLVLNGEIVPCYDYRIFQEYKNVLSRPKFGFSKSEVNGLLDWISAIGISIVASPTEEIFTDEADRKFYEVAKSGHALLVTGNTKHFPKSDFVITVNDFFEKYNK